MSGQVEGGNEMTVSQSMGGIHAAGPFTESQLNQLFSRITRRIIPILTMMFVVAFIDRVNVGFAKLQMLSDLNFTNETYGLGAGIFFIGYALFQIPCNLYLYRFGARKVLAGITVLWGFVSIVNLFVKTPIEFYSIRFLLGVAEAGFSPGIILYLSGWYPSSLRASMIGLIFLGQPAAFIVGGPISGYIMRTFVGVGGLANWQWLFLLEGLPAVILGACMYIFVTDGPDSAAWLSGAEKKVIEAALEDDRRKNPPVHSSFVASLSHPVLWQFGAIYFCWVFGFSALQFWTPTMLAQAGISNFFYIGLITGALNLVAALCMTLNSRHSDAVRERRLHFSVALVIGAIMFVAVSQLSAAPVLLMIALGITSGAMFAPAALFWEMPIASLSGTAIAGGLALINSIGVTAGFVSQYAIGFVLTRTNSIALGLILTAAFTLLGAVLVVVLVPRKVA